MKQSGVEWIGEIPDDWDIRKLKYIGKYINGYAFKPEDWKYTGRPIIRIQDLTSINENPNYYDGELNECYEVKNGDILVSWAATLDAFIWKKETGWLNQHIFKAEPFIEKVNKSYFFWLIKESMKNMNNDNKHGIVMQHVTLGVFNNFEIPLPPKETQKRIASYLDKKCNKIDETILSQQQVIDKLKAYKQSLITEAVTGKIKIQKGKVCGKYESYKDSGVECIGKIPSEWDCKRLKFIVNSFKKGNGITKDEVFVDGDTPCVRYGELYTKYNYSFTECFSKTRKDLLQTLQYFSYGDILFTCTGELIEEIGKNTVYLGNEKCLAGGDLIIASHSQNPSFLSYALNSNYAQTQKSMGKAKLKVVHISAREIGNILTILPPIKEQERIANFLDKQCIAIDSSIEKKQKLIEKLTEYKKSLIYECVTGKKEIYSEKSNTR